MGNKRLGGCLELAKRTTVSKYTQIIGNARMEKVREALKAFIFCV